MRDRVIGENVDSHVHKVDEGRETEEDRPEKRTVPVGKQTRDVRANLDLPRTRPGPFLWGHWAKKAPPSLHE